MRYLSAKDVQCKAVVWFLFFTFSSLSILFRPPLSPFTFLSLGELGAGTGVDKKRKEKEERKKEISSLIVALCVCM